MAIDLRGLRSFVAVASSGSISGAAESRHIAQPALSLQIKRIEDELGAALFERHARGVVLTGVGERFLAHAQDILRRVDLACEDVQAAVGEPSGRVAIGMPQSMAQFLAVPIVSHAVKHWPKLQLQVIEMSSGYVPEDLLRGRIDIGLTFGMEGDARIRFTHLMDEDLALATSAEQLDRVVGVNAPTNGEIALKAVQKFPVILPAQAHSLRRRIEEYLQQARVQLQVIAEVNTIPRLIELTRSGVASTILSYPSVRDEQALGKLVVLKIVQPQMHRPVYSCRLATTPLSIAATKVQELMHRTVEELTASGAWPKSTESAAPPSASTPTK